MIKIIKLVVFLLLSVVINSCSQTENAQSESIEFYQNQSILTEPGEFSYLYNDLPDDPVKLAQITRNVLMHGVFADQIKYEPIEKQKDGDDIRNVEDILKKIIELAPITT